MVFSGYRVKCEFSVGEAIGQIVIWLLLSIITLGLALFVLPYYFVRAPLNRSYLVNKDGQKVVRMNTEIAFGDILGHALVWLLLTIVTLGLAYLIYWPVVIRRMLNAVTLIDART